QLDAGVAVGDVAQHPGNDPPAVERVTVRRGGAFAAGRPGDVGVPAAAHPAPRRGFQIVGPYRDPGEASVRARRVDLRLDRTSDADRLAHAGHHAIAATLIAVSEQRLETNRPANGLSRGDSTNP